MVGLDKNDRQLMDFGLVSATKNKQYSADLLIYYVIDGQLTITYDERKVSLKDKDFLLVNAFQTHGLELGKETLATCFRVNVEVLSGYYDVSKMEFVGDTTKEDSGRHNALRRLMDRCIAYYYGKKSENGRILLKLMSLYYEITECLIADFSVVKKNVPDKNAKEYEEDLIREMTRYIQLNFHSPLRLEDLAEHFYLSPAYVSRYFKKKLGVNFAKYIANLRLDEAVADLEKTDKPLTRIAMDCGFSNLASFNKAFKERYQVNPKNYRSEHNHFEEIRMLEEQAQNQAEFRLLDYFENNQNLLEEEYDDVEQIEAETSSYTILNKTWNKMINIGGAALVLQKVIQDQILFLCKTLEFEYVRIWDLYARDMHLNAGDKNGKYNFNRLDMCLDFFTEHHIKPYIELGFKPFLLLKDYEEYTIHEVREIPFEDEKEYGTFLHRLMNHLVNRYSLPEVSNWIFEIWCDPRWFLDGEGTDYINYFEAAYHAIKNVVPLARVGGEYDRAYYGTIDFEEFIQKWSIRIIQPDFISIYCYPPIIRDEIGIDFVQVEQQQSFRIRDYIKEKKNTLLKYGMCMPVYSSEWNFTVINANVLNDSRFKGAYIMDALMSIYDQADLWGYWFASDLFVEEDDAPMLLNGRCGMITHQNICKPAYWAFRFMNRLEQYVLAKTPNVMVTMDDFDSYVVACHNYKPLDIPYFVQKEKDVTIESIPHLYVNSRHKIIKIKITGVQNGLYNIKTRVINSKYGSVQDEWMRMNRVANLTKADVEYVEHMSRPHITISEQMVTDHTLHFTTEMESQEIQLLHVFRHSSET